MSLDDQPKKKRNYLKIILIVIVIYMILSTFSTCFLHLRNRGQPFLFLVQKFFFFGPGIKMKQPKGVSLHRKKLSEMKQAKI